MLVSATMDATTVSCVTGDKVQTASNGKDYIAFMKNEMIEKAKQVQTPEELLVLARENGTPLTEEEAERYFRQLHPTIGELSDDELDDVSGGGCGGSDSDSVETDNGDYFYQWVCPNCKSRVFVADKSETTHYCRNCLNAYCNKEKVYYTN